MSETAGKVLYRMEACNGMGGIGRKGGGAANRQKASSGQGGAALLPCAVSTLLLPEAATPRSSCTYFAAMLKTASKATKDQLSNRDMTHKFQ